MKIQTRIFCNISRAAVSAPTRLSSRRGQKKRAIWLFPMAILALLTSAQTAQAVIVTSGQVNPSNPSTWTSGYGGTTVYIGKTSTGSVKVNGGSGISSNISYIGYNSGSTGIATVSGPVSNWMVSDELYVGRDGKGTLNIIGGGKISSSGTYSNSYIGYGSGSIGIATVHGPGSKWTSSDDLYVGREGKGTLNITGGGEVGVTVDSFIGFYSASTGIVKVHGPGSQWTNSEDLTVGRAGKGTLNITGGGEVINSGSSYDTTIGFYSGSTGIVRVTGAGSKWTNTRALYVGRDGNGTLRISGGGKVSGSNSYYSNSYIGYGSGSTGIATVSGPGSQWTNTRTLYVGYDGKGTLKITGGSEVSSSDTGYIGYNSGSTGIVTVHGIGSKWAIEDSLYVGRYGKGTLKITGGGEVSNSGSYYDSYISSSTDSTGIVTVHGIGSKWKTADDLYVGQSGKGTLDITGGGLTMVGGELTIDRTYGTTYDSSINMKSGGMLAIKGDVDDDLTQFLSIVNGTDAIRYWDGSKWDALTNATLGSDYSLNYYGSSHDISRYDVNGYTVLTVGVVPEPNACLLAVIGLVGLSFRRRKS